jgi:DNA modification methylase
MAASIPWNILERQTKRPLTVLDPMAGSGTTIVVARILGHQAVGFDTDPLAVLIAACWSNSINERIVVRAMDQVSAKAASWRTIRSKDAYPVDADEETRAFVRYWFDLTSRKQLAALSKGISSVRNRAVQRLLWCAFSRLIIVKQAGASLAMDVAHSRPHRAYRVAPIKPLDHFQHSVRRVLRALPFASDLENPPAARMNLGDARKLPLDACSVDVVITSPPYLNAIDYMRGHRLSLVWMQRSIEKLRAIRSDNIGTEAGRSDTLTDQDLVRAFKAGTAGSELSRADKGMFTRYLRDVRQVLAEIGRVLKPRGLAVLVVGDCNLGGVFVRNSSAIRALAANQGLRLVSQKTRALPSNRRYLPPPESRQSGRGLRKRLREEVVLSFALN